MGITDGLAMAGSRVVVVVAATLTNSQESVGGLKRHVFPSM